VPIPLGDSPVHEPDIGMQELLKFSRSALLPRNGMALGLAYVLLMKPAFCHAATGCSVPASVAGWHVVTVNSAGLAREVPVYTPASAVGRAGLPLVFDLHGSGGNGRQQALRSGLTVQADREGFLLANPNGGIADPGSPTEKFYWHVPGVPLFGSMQMPANAPDDVQFFRDAIPQLERAACADPHRIYVTGFSGGGRMASALACELSDRIAAAAPVSGLRAGAPKAGDFEAPDTKACEPHRAISLITFHGVQDPTNRFNGDGELRWGYSVPVALNRWAHLEGCQSSPSEQPVSVHVTKVTYRGCRDDAELILYRTDAAAEHGGGHIWPHPSTSAQESALATEEVDELDASALIWEFFSRHHS
jgi:polyhydroxybutyrate depolymerase